MSRVRQIAVSLDEQDLINAPPPPLKWAGGKRWLVPVLRDLYRPYRSRRLVEPCVGGLAVSLGLMPERALLNDVNPHLINFYRQLKRGLRHELRMKNDRTRYYSARCRFNRLIEEGAANSSEAAAIFYFLNRTGFNGLCRFNSRGYFNVPFGRHKTINYLEDFSVYERAFRRWQFSSKDFEALVIERGDFVYIDPPYDVPFTQYSAAEFTWGDQERLALWASRLKAPVVMSNQATPRILGLYRKLGFKLRLLFAPRMISCTGSRAKAQEVLATKNM